LMCFLQSTHLWIQWIFPSNINKSRHPLITSRQNSIWRYHKDRDAILENESLQDN
jgi:hypothetical protein